MIMPCIDVRAAKVYPAVILIFLLTPARAPAQDLPAAEQQVHEFDPAQVEVVVVGTPHLSQMNPKGKPAIDLIRRGLARFDPDHIAVEWLHPSIDPATTNNYQIGRAHV